MFLQKNKSLWSEENKSKSSICVEIIMVFHSVILYCEIKPNKTQTHQETKTGINIPTKTENSAVIWKKSWFIVSAILQNFSGNNSKYSLLGE